MGPTNVSPPLSTTAVRRRLLVLAGLGVVVAAALLLYANWRYGGAIPQEASYHRFAGDQRSWLGMPRAANVLSNAPFLVIGVLGIALAWRRRAAFLDSAEVWPYFTFFVGIALTAFGSAYYHLDPTNPRLVWDRLPITMAFMALFAALIGERVGVRAGLLLLGPLMAFGLASVYYWTFGEARGHGDLRPYYFVQIYPLLAIPLLLALFPPRYTHGSDMLIAIACYLAAKVCEEYDPAIYRLLLETVSGHTIKHLLSAVGAALVVHMLWCRRAVATAA